MEPKARFFFACFLATLVLKIEGEEVIDVSPCDFPAIYNFGDSNSDTGGGSAAFYPMAPPCGETFFHRPAGRGCDGRLLIDFIGITLQSNFNFSSLELDLCQI